MIPKSNEYFPCISEHPISLSKIFTKNVNILGEKYLVILTVSKRTQFSVLLDYMTFFTPIQTPYYSHKQN